MIGIEEFILARRPALADVLIEADAIVTQLVSDADQGVIVAAPDRY
jgi:hypothetical protein